MREITMIASITFSILKPQKSSKDVLSLINLTFSQLIHIQQKIRQ